MSAATRAVGLTIGVLAIVIAVMAGHGGVKKPDKGHDDKPPTPPITPPNPESGDDGQKHPLPIRTG
jgi:hypothetical protein